MNQRSMYPSIAAALLIAMMSLTPAALAQRATRLSAPVESRVVSIGKMIRSGQSRNGTPRFALLDDAGSTTAYVIPRAGANLSVHLNKQVAVTARRSTKSTNGITYLLAEKVTPMGQEPTPAEATPTVANTAVQVQAVTASSPSAMERTPEPLPSISAVPLLPKPEAVPQLAMDAHPLAEATAATPQVSFDEEMLFWEEHDAPKIRRVSHELHPSIMGGVPSAANAPNTVMAHPGIPSEMIVQGDPYMETAGPVLHGAGCAGDCDGSCGLGGACSVPCTSSCCPCGPSGRFWIRAEYLLWWAKGMDTPALVTTTAGTPLAQDAGVLGTDGTSVLYGDDEILDGDRNGFRFRTGWWMDPCQWRGFEFDAIFMEDVGESFSRNSVGAPILARPFYNVELDSEDAELVAYSGVVSGQIGIQSDSEFISLAPRFRCNLKCENFSPNPACGCGTCNPCGDTMCRPIGGQRVDFTLGYRYMGLDEQLTISEQLAANANGEIANFDLTDSFRTENDFHGAEIGLIWEYYRGPWSLEFFSRFAVGNNSRTVTINGSTVSAVGGSTFSDVGGLLALENANIGTYSDDEFVVIPELGVNLGWQIAPSTRFLVGYTFIYWNDVVRPGDQIDRRINPALLPPALDTTDEIVPAFTFNDSSYWLQGLNLGLDWRY